MPFPYTVITRITCLDGSQKILIYALAELTTGHVKYDRTVLSLRRAVFILVPAKEVRLSHRTDDELAMVHHTDSSRKRYRL
jgi:hypothetical protein